VCANEGAGPFWGPERGYNIIGEIWVSETYSSGLKYIDILYILV